ncbi:MAG TPA: aspartate carbamoyltransferase catalytic subunit, partial [Eubacteriales bacterium]|nr:aspartate carbamoyltransferase catalytic subunit [Eubacteriales bacterium]
MKGLLSLSGIPDDKILQIIQTALEFKRNLKRVSYSDLRMATLFFENSTRTQYSFQMAMMNLGITPVAINVSTSSVNKGESIYDTVRTLESIGISGVVIRHSRDGYFKELENVKIPVFNAGDGSTGHPTQTLLDLVTIYEEFGRFEGLKVSFAGDISHSRVAHGNSEIMKRLGMEVCISCPDEFADDTAPRLDFDEAVATSDVINLLRVQFERHSGGMSMSAAEYHARYGLTLERVAKMKEGAIIIHPAPINRGMEIADEVAECEKSRIFR